MKSKVVERILTNTPDWIKHKVDSFVELFLSDDGNKFYCQRKIEGHHICKVQCDHCSEYYRPLEEGRTEHTKKMQKDLVKHIQIG